ncbi:ABC transporter permease [Pontibacter sp. G13]|uniref:ABC transporter permease n=1 Tax=Pontibacter sp. G13 TaxID=3074898 RepID=UPI00288BB033|nr:ABC transporter permease [Pontibacter sp. G13]WNJ17549.1 ABC transporter permease [Pontibacter sp. G13]
MNVFQFLKEGTQMANHAIGNNRVRSVLTMVVVAIGIFLITGILTLFYSLRISLTQNLASLGNTTLFVHHWPWAEEREDWYNLVNRPLASYRDFRKLKDNLDLVEGVAYQNTIMNQTARAEGRSVSGIPLVGVTQDISVISDLALAEGRFFSEIEHHLASPFCVVGFNISDGLFPRGDAMGKYIRIRGKKFKIVGILERKGAGFMGMPSEDDQIFIPYTTASRAYNLTPRSVEKVIMIKASDYEDLEYVESEIRGIVRASRGLKPRMEDNFSINKQEAVMNSITSFFSIFDRAGWVISIFSLLIGVFSIANIMYMSVRERTNEIGIQMALGSTRMFILFQFITESILICIIGGLLGVGLVMLIGYAIEGISAFFGASMSVHFSQEIFIMGIALSFVTGFIAGILPAYSASRLDPVNAIRLS